MSGVASGQASSDDPPPPPPEPSNPAGAYPGPDKGGPYMPLCSSGRDAESDKGASQFVS